MRLLFKPVDLLTDLGAAIATLVLGILVSSLWYEVVSRYFFKAPTEWVQSVSLYCGLASVMLMLPHLSREGHHVGLSMIFDVLPHTVASWFSRIVSLLSCAVCMTAAAITSLELSRQYTEGVLTTDNIFMPLWCLTAIMVYGFVMAGLQFARRAASAFPPRGIEG